MPIAQPTFGKVTILDTRIMNADMGTTEAMVIEAGHPHLTGTELAQQITGQTVLGDYAAFFKYSVRFDNDGTMEGRNNVGAHHFGRWKIDNADNSLSVQWDHGWHNNTSRAYAVDGKLKFFDTDTGDWQTTFVVAPD